ncbi:MAG: chitobiase/beta-hexosaminidase C-terminal domain-containing protein, partial [Holophagales bacterium]|nr:chitobiase/beta-hexosaminidase C-terminal domain-containing protein [Holophagales bacterium]
VDLPNNLTTTEQTIVKARAFRDDLTPSGVAQQAYVIKAAAPALSPPGGTFPSAPTVAITSSTPGGQIRYTLDGSVPTASSTRYEGPFKVDGNRKLTAAVFKDRVVTSDPAAGPTAAPAEAPCPALVGIFLARFTVDSDLGGHAPFLNLQSATLTSSISLPNLTISGNHPSTVTGTGPLNTATCTGSATGTGVIAGFPGIRCDYANVTISGNQITGSYTCGVGGGLPGNQPIRYLFTGTR